MKNYLSINGQKIEFNDKDLLDCLVTLITYSNNLNQKGLDLSSKHYSKLFHKLDKFYNDLDIKQ